MFYSFFFFVCPKDISFLAGAKRATRYEQVASLRASSPFVGYCEKKTREGHARGHAKAWGGVEKGELAIRSLSSDVFERRTSTGSEVFSLLTCLDDIKFVFLNFFTVIEAI